MTLHTPAVALGMRTHPNYMLFRCPKVVDAAGDYDVFASMCASTVVSAGGE